VRIRDRIDVLMNSGRAARDELWRLTCRALKAANSFHAYLRKKSQEKTASDRTKDADKRNRRKNARTLKNPRNLEPRRTL
jgi:hypothetical protein